MTSSTSMQVIGVGGAVGVAIGAIIATLEEAYKIDNRRRVVSVVMGVVMGVAIGYKLTAMNLQLKEHRPTKELTEHVQYNLFAFAELENLLYSSFQVGCPKNVTRTRACVHFWWRL